MKMKKIYAIYFSPCGNVKNIIEFMARKAASYMEMDEITVIDFTLPEAREKVYEIEEESFVFFGSPVYAGRVPNKIMPFIENGFQGHGAMAVPVVSFGNRSFDHALIELKLLLEKNQFRPVAAAAVVSEHSFSDKLAGGRPDQADYERMEQFVEEIINNWKNISKTEEKELCLEVPGENPPTVYYTPLGQDLKPAKFLKAKPIVDSQRCNQCKKCVDVCPVGSISWDDPEVTTGICIKCHACIHKCPQKAKSFNDEAFLSHKAMLEENYTRRAESTFIPGRFTDCAEKAEEKEADTETKRYPYLLWDIDGTVLDFLAAEKAAIQKLFPLHGLGICTDEMVERYSRINVKYWEKLERNEMTKPEILVGRYREFFETEGLDPEKAAAFNDDYQLALGDTIVFHDDAYHILEDLKEEYTLIAITNGTKTAQTKKLKESGLDQIFDYVFISEDVGFEKPNVEYFHQVMKEVKIDEISKCLVIGDSLTSDIQGGVNMGMDTCWYNPLGKENKSELVPDYVIGNLHEVLEILKKA